MQAKLVSDFGSVHCVGKILLVSENKEESIPELVFVKHALKFLSCFYNTITIV